MLYWEEFQRGDVTLVHHVSCCIMICFLTADVNLDCLSVVVFPRFLHHVVNIALFVTGEVNILRELIWVYANILFSHKMLTHYFLAPIGRSCLQPSLAEDFYLVICYFPPSFYMYWLEVFSKSCPFSPVYLCSQLYRDILFFEL